MAAGTKTMGFSSAGDDLDATLAALSFDHSNEALLATITTSARSFGIRPADSEGHRRSAGMLINKMYAWRGYESGFAVGEHPDQMTLVASDYRAGSAIGTLTIGIDGKHGLLVDTVYKAEAEKLRASGCHLCEMIKFAVEHSVNSKPLLGALFHVAFIFAYYIHQRTDILIEVTPQHARFYRHLLCFETFGDVKLNPRVNTEGVLMRLELDYAADQIRRYGGQGRLSSERSLYPYGFSESEERGVIERLKHLEAGTP